MPHPLWPTLKKRGVDIFLSFRPDAIELILLKILNHVFLIFITTRKLSLSEYILYKTTNPICIKKNEINCIASLMGPILLTKYRN
jgi:hypothetical protein